MACEQEVQARAARQEESRLFGVQEAKAKEDAWPSAVGAESVARAE